MIRGSSYSIWMSFELQRLIAEAAQIAGLPSSTWAKKALIEAAKALIESSKKPA